MLRTVPCLQVFEGSRVPRLVDFQTLVGQSLKSPLVRNATSRKAGKLHCSLQPIPKSTYINLTWSGLSSQIWLKTMKHPSSLSQAMSLNYIVLHQHILKKKTCVCDYSEDKSPLKRHGQKMFLPVAGPPHKSQRPQRCD